MAEEEPIRSGADWYAERLHAVLSMNDSTEADVRETLVRPILESVLTFRFDEIQAERTSDDSRTGRKRRPDYIACRPGSSRATVIIEVKKLGTDLMRRTGGSWESAPLGQLEAYLRGHRQSGDGTWGLATNGVDWIITKRDGDDVRLDRIERVQIRSSADAERLLSRINSAPAPRSKPILTEDDVDWLDAAAESDSPEAFLKASAGGDLLHGVTVGEGFAHVATGAQWDAPGFIPQTVFAACLRLEFPDGLLAPSDISAAISRIGALAGEGVVGLAYTDSGAGGTRLCRGFVQTNGRLHATALIDPLLPGSRAERQFAAISRRWRGNAPSKLVEALSSTPLQRQFHEQVGQWFATTSQGANELRHLIRVLFAWLLQERGVLPDGALWDSGRTPAHEHEVHRHVTWLFTQALATPKDAREVPGHPWRRYLAGTVPFLNGSLFSKLRRSEMPDRLTNEQYLGKEGLLTILHRFDWTLHDRTGHTGESALDPTLLGDIDGIRLEGEEYVHHKMPGGTYYTPQDVAEEMAADAIAGWLAPRLAGVAWGEVRELAHPAPGNDAWLQWPLSERQRAKNLLRDATFLDPCAGSGVFTLAMMHTLWRVARRLAPEGTPPCPEALEEIIERQLHAVDIHPMAVLITRLRIFIALVDARSRLGRGGGEPKPLPNLETRCMVADTLCVNLAPQERMAVDGGEWNAGLGDLRAARSMWTAAHYPDEKEIALAAEREARSRLAGMARQWGADGAGDWLAADFLSANAPPARFDIRRLFPAPKGGWDIVIGNPPYQKPDQAERDRGVRLGYDGAAGNLYLMFIEMAVHVAAERGCVTLVVPHSIVFGRQRAFAAVRRAMEAAGESIRLRTFDNMPQPLFPKLAWLKQAEHGVQNRQRATVLSLRKRPAGGQGRADVFSAGLVRLSAGNRNAVMRRAPTYTQQARWQGQWTQAPTPELAELLNAMRREPPSSLVGTGERSVTATYPPTAMYFLSCLPPDALRNPRRKDWGLPAGPLQWPWIGLYNSSLFHAYWLMVGDAFDVTQQELGSVRAPAGWKKEALRRQTERVAKRLMEEETLDACRVMKMNVGEQHNVNFHREGTPGPAIIHELDCLLLEAYGLQEDPLIEHMRVIRTESAHLLWPEDA